VQQPSSSRYDVLESDERNDRPDQGESMNTIDVHALEALGTEFIREQDALQKRYDDRAKEIALPIVQALRLGKEPVKLDDAWCDEDGTWVDIQWWVEEKGLRFLRGRTLSAEELTELLQEQSAE
jgi:hypothetical protein